MSGSCHLSWLLPSLAGAEATSGDTWCCFLKVQNLWGAAAAAVPAAAGAGLP